MSTAKFPLDWPDGWPRTPPHKTLGQLAGGENQTWDSVVRRLFGELGRLDAKNVVLSTNQPLRRDGYPYAAKRLIRDPGVAVYFVRGGRPLVMAQDRYDKLIDNIRSLAISIEGLRKMERHGGHLMVERAFRGFEALPAPESEQPWHRVFGFAKPPHDFLIVKQSYRELVQKYHSDRPEGSHERMIGINKALAEAKVHYGIRS